MPMRKNTRAATIAFFATGFALFCAASPRVVTLASNCTDQARIAERFSGQGKAGAVKLNKAAFEYARELIDGGHVVVDERGAWSEDQPSAEEENEFIRLHSFGEYAKWHLGVNDNQGGDTKARFKFPYGDFNNVHRCAMLAVKNRAAQYKYYDIENAAAQLVEMIEKAEKIPATPRSKTTLQNHEGHR
jgi:hypothetical protein